MATQSTNGSYPRDLVTWRQPFAKIASLITPDDAAPLTFDEYAKAAIDVARSAQEDDRRTLTQRRWDLLNDAWGPLLIAHIRNLVHPDIATAMMGQGEEQVNIGRNTFKDVVEKLAITYDAPAARSTEPPEAWEAYERLIKGTYYHTLWKAVDRKLHGFNTVLVHPSIVHRNGGKQLRHRIFTGDQATVITAADDPTEAIAVVLVDRWVPADGDPYNPETRYVVWKSDADGLPAWHGVFDGRARRVDDGDGMNPYGVLPFTRITLYPFEDHYWAATQGEDLITTTVNLGFNGTDTQYKRKMHGFKMIAAVGRSVDRGPPALLDPATRVEVTGNDAKIQVIDWQIDFTQLYDADDKVEARAASSRGLNPDAWRSTSAQTAQGARLAERGLAEKRHGVREIFAVAEQEYYSLVSRVAAVAGLSETPDPAAVLTVVHAPIEYPEDPLVQAQVDAAEAAMGTASLIEVVQRRRPGWGDDRAKQFLIDNIETQAELNEIKTKRNVPDRPDIQATRQQEQDGQMGGRPPEGNDGA